MTAALMYQRKKQLPAHSVSIEIYSDIPRFSCDNMAFLFTFNPEPLRTAGGAY